MPFAKQSEIELERIAEEVLSRLRASDVDPISATRGKSFAEMERAARAVAQRVATRLTAQMFAESSDESPEFAPCPKCHHNWRVTRKKRLIVTADGPVEYLEPAAHCENCRSDFFPSASTTGTRRTEI